MIARKRQIKRIPAKATVNLEAQVQTLLGRAAKIDGWNNLGHLINSALLHSLRHFAEPGEQIAVEQWADIAFRAPMVKRALKKGRGK